ncbi:MAG: sigma-70 family RNA polymerase sigma factor [Acidobacteria bacterium]|nr:sigma-70 family RNA polymerase sigma factor [Acidobacteriota bacterium]MBI3471544.1 sigma-70 family RNA polymerase sigma factor [Candidatus Solibacter usitatus]
MLLHERQVYRTALRLLGNVADAQDAAQEVFLRLHKHHRSFDTSRPYAPWLYRVTVNVCRDTLRRRRPMASLDGVEPAAPAEAADAVERGEQRRRVLDALARLPEKERAAVVLRDIEGLPTGEVARILGSSEATVRSQTSKARVKIRQFLRRYL